MDMKYIFINEIVVNKDIKYICVFVTSYIDAMYIICSDKLVL